MQSHILCFCSTRISMLPILVPECLVDSLSKIPWTRYKCKFDLIIQPVSPLISHMTIVLAVLVALVLRVQKLSLSRNEAIVPIVGIVCQKMLTRKYRPLWRSMSTVVRLPSKYQWSIMVSALRLPIHTTGIGKRGWRSYWRWFCIRL